MFSYYIFPKFLCSKNIAFLTFCIQNHRYLFLLNSFQNILYFGGRLHFVFSFTKIIPVCQDLVKDLLPEKICPACCSHHSILKISVALADYTIYFILCWITLSLYLWTAFSANILATQIKDFLYNVVTAYLINVMILSYSGFMSSMT